MKWPAINIKVILSSAAISCILITCLLQGPHIWYQSAFLGSLGEISAQIFFFASVAGSDLGIIPLRLSVGSTWA